MGLFDLDEYKRKQQRADESATEPRAFPEVFAEATFGGRKQKLRFQPVLFDGGHVFISFRPELAAPEHDLMAGGSDIRGYEHEDLPLVPEALVVGTDDAFSPDKWLQHAVRGVEAGHFGRLVVEENEYHSFDFHFFGSTGIINTEHYLMILDGSYQRGFEHAQSDYDPEPLYELWAKPEEAADLLVRLNENEFALHLERQKADTSSIYGTSSRWNDMEFEEKHALLPSWELEIERELLPLMRAVVWSGPSFGYGDQIQGVRGEGKPFWRRPRFWIKPDRDKGDVFHLEQHLETRILKIWPHIVARFWPQIETLDRTEVHPAVLHWMEYRGAYLIEFDTPNAHEHLEARLLLRDFLYQKGVSLDKLERE